MNLFALSLGFLGVALIVTMPSASACGIDWNVPSNHFDGVNEAGELSYWRDIGQIDFGGDFKIPLVIGFKPTRGSSSCLGRGWIIPVLESNIVQIDERKFLLTQPDGITRIFWRTKSNDSVLQGQGNWKGEIKENIINLWAECGWKLTFTKGKIISFTTPDGRVIKLIYVNGRVSEIQEHGRTVLRVESDSVSGQVSGLSFEANHVGIEFGEKPRVETIQGTNVVGGIEQSLHLLTFQGGMKALYEFGVDEKFQPTLKISGDRDRLFTWDPATGRLLKDGDWTYDIKPASNRWANAAIGRVNASKQSEFWFEDKERGQEIIQGVDGVRKITAWFTSGPCVGLIRDISETKNGQTQQIYHPIYNESAQVVAARGRDVNDPFINHYDASKRLERTNYASGKEVKYEYLKEGARVITLKNKKGIIRATIGSEEQILESTIQPYKHKT